MVTEAKIKEAESLREDFKNATVAVLANFKGVTVQQSTELRMKLREGSGRLKIVKNSLAKIASKETQFEGLSNLFKGPVAVAMGFGEDISAPAKTLLDFEKENGENMTILGGVIEGECIGVADVKKLADMPPKPVVQAMLLGVLTAPVRNLLGALSDVGRRPLNVLKAKAEQG